MNEKMRFALRVIITTAVILAALLFAATVFSKGTVIQGAIGIGVVAILTIFALKFLKMNYKRVAKGIPQEDEFSSKMKIKAGYYAFLVTIYVQLAIMWYGYEAGSDLPELSVPHAAALTILVMAILFGVFYLYLSGQGGVE